MRSMSKESPSGYIQCSVKLTYLEIIQKEIQLIWHYTYNKNFYFITKFMRMKQANNLKLYNFMNIMSKFKQVLNFLSIKNIFMVLPTFNSVLPKIKTKKMRNHSTQKCSTILLRSIYNVLWWLLYWQKLS